MSFRIKVTDKRILLPLFLFDPNLLPLWTFIIDNKYVMNDNITHYKQINLLCSFPVVTETSYIVVRQ